MGNELTEAQKKTKPSTKNASNRIIMAANAFALGEQAYEKFESLDYKTAVELYERAAVASSIAGDKKSMSLFNSCAMLIYCIQNVNDHDCCEAKFQTMENQLSAMDVQYLKAVMASMVKKDIYALVTVLQQRDAQESMQPQLIAILLSLKNKMQNDEEYCDMI